MVSPELLRRYPFFGNLNEEQLKKIAMIAVDLSVPSGTKLFDECQSADALYLLVDGDIDLKYKYEEEFHPEKNKEFLVGEINPGEIFGISSLIEPYEYNAAAVASKDSRILKMAASNMRPLLSDDPELACTVMHQVAKAIMERLAYTRIQLAAAWA